MSYWSLQEFKSKLNRLQIKANTILSDRINKDFGALRTGGLQAKINIHWYCKDAMLLGCLMMKLQSGPKVTGPPLFI